MQKKVLFWLIVMALLWGPSFLFIKIAVNEIPPLTLSASRVGLASLLLLGVLWVQGRRLPKFGPIWTHFAVMGIVSNAVPFTLLNWGEQYIDSAIAAILIGTTPLFTIFLAHIFMANDRLTGRKLLGALLGFAGLSLLFGPALLGGVQATLLGLLAATTAAASYAIAIIYGKRYLHGLPPLVAPTAQLVMATVFLMPVSLVVDQPFSLALPTWPAILALAAVAVFGTTVAYVAYYHTMEFATATELSMVTYLVPIVGAVMGMVVLNERLGWNGTLGCGLIIVGVMVVNGVLKFRTRRRPVDLDGRSPNWSDLTAYSYIFKGVKNTRRHGQTQP